MSELRRGAGLLECFCEAVRGIGERYGRGVDTMATDGNHVHVHGIAIPVIMGRDSKGDEEFDGAGDISRVR